VSFIFFDTETSGTETFFDQILQFAAIRTDANLKELDRFEIRCRLLPHVVAAPGAVSVTGVRVSQLIDPSFASHYEMVRAIRAKLISWSPSLFMGWNSIEFDERLIRQALYQTLHKPYLTNTDGNSRSDVMRIVQAASLFAPEALIFPSGDDGKKLFKLDRIAPANGFKHDRAHDAMGDVEATIFLCQLLADKAPHIWSSFMRYSSKAAVIDFISTEKTFCLSDFYFGNPYSYLVASIGHNQENKAEWYVYDLSIDPQSLQSLSDPQLATRLGISPKPVRRLKSNAAPMLFPAEDAPEICKGRSNGTEELERRTELLQEGSALRVRLVAALELQKKKYPPSIHVEKQIYDGFVEESDAALMDAFHAAAWPQRVSIAENFQDPRLRTLGRRLIHLERPDLLEGAVCKEHDVAAAKRILGLSEDVSWLTLPKALAELEEMLKGASGAELELLQEHKQHLRERRERALLHVK
jgi:exodeoxyribonuclease-1